MAKKILALLVLVTIACFVYQGAGIFISSHRTAKSVAESFMNDVSKGDSLASYQLLSVSQKKARRQSDWNSYLRTLAPASLPKLISETKVNDRFNVYPKDSSPERLVYSMRTKNRNYQVVAVILKEDGAWKIDDFQGDYKQ